MSKGNWTKGPWFHERNSGVVGDGSRWGGRICELNEDLEEAEEEEGNGNLIAAAPELFDMLEELIDACDGNYRELTDECKKVLAKALGKEAL